MTCSRLTLGAAVLALLVPLTSCGLVRDARESAETRGEDERVEVAVEDPAEAEQGPEAGSAEDALPYLEALGRSSDPALMEEGLEYAHPDWPAHGYLQHQANGARANRISGYSLDDDSVELSGENIQLCTANGCNTFAEFEFADGLLADFKVNGNLVSDNFHPGGGSTTVNGITATVASAYYATGADVLVVFADVETDAAEVSVLDATHNASGGRISFLDPFYGVSGRDHFTSGSPGQVMLQFESAPLGGKVDLVLQCIEVCTGEVFLKLPLE